MGIAARHVSVLVQLQTPPKWLQVVDYVVFDLQGNAICNVGDVAVAPESVPEQTFTPVEWGLLELCQVMLHLRRDLLCIRPARVSWTLMCLYHASGGHGPSAQLHAQQPVLR